MTRIFRWICIVVIVIGCGMVLYPNVEYFMTSYQYHKVIEEVDKKKSTHKNKENDALYQDMQQYNEQIYANGQANLKDAWSYEQASFQLLDYGIIEESIGYITIESINVKLPLYLGASKANLSQGATVLGQTSMPIGGENTNCVIAAHRKMKKHPMLSDIEKVQIGDEVLIDNLWETLHYQVTEIKVISPSDIDAIKIQEGKDMVTIITCHPYPYNYQRYVLYCQKAGTVHNLNNDNKKENIISSQSQIDQEKALNTAGLALVAALIFVMIVRQIYKSKKRRL